MKLLFVYYTPSGGMETLNRMRCQALQAAGVECHQLYLQNGFGLENIRNIPTYVTDRDQDVSELLAREAYDAIVVTCNYYIVPKLRGFGYGGRIIFEAQGFGYGAKEKAQEALAHAMGYLNGRIDAVFYPPTPHLAEYFRMYYPGLRHYCFHTPLDVKVFRPLAVEPPARPILGWVGRLEDNKNWRELLAIGARLVHAGLIGELWMFVDDSLSVPEDRAAFMELVPALGLQPYLTIRSNVKHAEMPEVYSRIGRSGGLLISTSKIEAAPYAVLEAMSCRCPVLATDSDGVRIFVTHNETGKFYPIGNVEAAVFEARMLMHDAALRESILSRALRKVQEGFTLERYREHFLRMLAELGVEYGG
ncbi:glycosyltransferase family 4 protein [Gorillibacterium sp. sgz5001074]|uniref:glycosyltransferase family 4 protein n=1 Tax=Gorillibacterium sp. sgz5001074 TaxID=3446695 RepID=UPI003F669019